MLGGVDAEAPMRLTVIGAPITVHGADTMTVVPAGTSQRLVGLIVANGGSITFDQVTETLWAGDDVARSRAPLRRVLWRLQRAVGDLVVRTGSGLQLSPTTTCDLYDFERRARDALAEAGADPERAGRLATAALGQVDEPVFADFQYDEWALATQRRVDRVRISLLDLLSTAAEDSGDLATAQALAERALRLDRQREHRYIRLSELLVQQGRIAAAIAVLDDLRDLERAQEDDAE